MSIASPKVRKHAESVDVAHRVLLLVVTVALCLGTLEGIGCVWERETAEGTLGWTLVASRRMPVERHGPADGHYYLLKPDRRYVWEGIPVHIRTNGLRTGVVSQSKPPDTFRILNLGDSVVFGWRVSEEDTYGARLKARLDRLDDSVRYQVSNAGVPGWNLTMARHFLSDKGSEYRPAVILLDITLVNDVRARGFSYPPDGSWTEWLRDHTYAWPFLTIQARFLLARQRGPEAFPVLNPPRSELAYWPTEEEDPAWRRVWEDVTAIRVMTRELGARLVVVVFPTAFQLHGSGHSDYPQRLLSRRATDAGIEIIDLLPIYRDACAQAPVGACEGYDNLLFGDIWMHPNPFGHELAAEALATAILTADRAE